jgi:hypothetical protein
MFRDSRPVVEVGCLDLMSLDDSGRGVSGLSADSMPLWRRSTKAISTSDARISASNDRI